MATANNKGGAKVGMIPHAWINYPNNANKKCTRCGMTKHYVKHLYIHKKDGITLPAYEGCIKFEISE